jgi:hypothetical protein
MCGIAAQLSPVPDSSGIQVGTPSPFAAAPLNLPAHLRPVPLPNRSVQLMQADTFDLHSFHTLTGTTFMLLTEPHTPDATELLRTT